MSIPGREEKQKAGAGRLMAGLVLFFALLWGPALGEGLLLSLPEEGRTGEELSFGIAWRGEEACDVTVSLTALYANGTAAFLDADRALLLPGEETALTVSVPYACRIHLEADGTAENGETDHREAFLEVSGTGADWPEMVFEGPESCLTGEEAVFSVLPRGGTAPYTVRLTAALQGEAPLGGTWRSDGEAVLGRFAFTGAGTVLAEAEVTDALGLKAYGEWTCVCSEAPVRLQADRTELTEGDSVGLRVLQSGGKWTFSSDDPTVVRVDENGTVTAAGQGTASVTAAAEDGTEASLLFRILPAAEKLTVEGLSLQPGQQGRLRPVLEPAGASSRYLFLSANEDVAAVDQSGVVTAIAPGTAVLAVIALDRPAVSRTVHVRVADEAEERVRAYAYGLFWSGSTGGGELAAAYGALSGGECTYTLTLSRDGTPLNVKSRDEAGVIRFYLSDPVPGTYTLSAAARDESGLLSTASAEGILSVEESGQVSLRTTREELPPVLTEKLTLSGPETAYVGRTAEYALKAEPEGVSGPYRWESSNGDAAQVDQQGVLTVLGEGETLLSVRALDGSGVKAEMRVTCVLETLGIGADEIVIHRGDRMPLRVASGTGRVYEYLFTSSDPGLFRVEDGVLYALNEGSGTLSIACAGGECGTEIPVRVAPCLHREGEWQTLKEPTCLQDGERSFVCAFCGERVRTETVPALAHDTGRWSTRVPATPLYPGERIRRCTRCGAVLERDLLPCITGNTYNLNTACSEGFCFRDLFRVREWYMFTPLDVSRDGVYPLRFIASNMYQIGTVYVTVKGGQICVTYQLADPSLKFSDEFITFLPGLEAFRGADPAHYRNYAFGIWYDLDDLGCGDGLAFLFIRNRINYEKDTPGLVMFGTEQPTHKETLRRLLWMLDAHFGS